MKGLLTCVALVATLALCASVAVAQPGAIAAGPVQMAPAQDNVDVRYPRGTPLPNDFDILLYGPGLTPDKVRWVYNTNSRNNTRWGRPEITQEPPRFQVDPETGDATPAFGLPCLRIRWKGPPRPELQGQLVHFGYSLQPGCKVLHREMWWTLDGEPIIPACDPQIQWICYPGDIWVICIRNPNPFPIYPYGCRWFLPQQFPPPRLLLTDLQPEQFGGQWNDLGEFLPIPPPPRPPIVCIRPWCPLYIVITGPPSWHPIVFQVAVRNNDDLPANFDPLGPPQPDDDGTVVVLTGRAVVQNNADLNADGVVDFADLQRNFAPHFGQVSPDVNIPPDPDDDGTAN